MPYPVLLNLWQKFWFWGQLIRHEELLFLRVFLSTFARRGQETTVQQCMSSLSQVALIALKGTNIQCCPWGTLFPHPPAEWNSRRLYPDPVRPWCPQARKEWNTFGCQYPHMKDFFFFLVNEGAPGNISWLLALEGHELCCYIFRAALAALHPPAPSQITLG